jgi:Fe2+ or Zn2+ uptake regulation protein
MDEPCLRFEVFLTSKGQRLSADRLTVTNAILAKTGVVVAESLVAELGGRVSRSTIYRTLNLMVEAGLLKDAGEFGHFEAVSD